MKVSTILQHLVEHLALIDGTALPIIYTPWCHLMHRLLSLEYFHLLRLHTTIIIMLVFGMHNTSVYGYKFCQSAKLMNVTNIIPAKHFSSYLNYMHWWLNLIMEFQSGQNYQTHSKQLSNRLSSKTIVKINVFKVIVKFCR